VNTRLENTMNAHSRRAGLVSHLQGLILLSAMATMGLVGCGDDISLHDDIDIHFDLNTFGQAPNRLHSPYVRGAEFNVSVKGKDTPSNVAVVSGNAQVLRKNSDSEDGRKSQFTAVSEGRTVFRAVKGEKTVRKGRVEVRAANHATLHFHGDVLFNQVNQETEARTPRILVGGTATFLVRYFRDDQRLHGHGVLSVDPPEGTTWDDGLGERLRRRIGFNAENEFLSVRAKKSHLLEDREWVEFSPKIEGEYTVTLRADGEPVGQVTIKAVGQDSVEAITVQKMNERGLSNGDFGLVLARAYDIDGNPVFGVEYSWDIDGSPQSELGDLYRYEFDKRNLATVCAMFSEHESIIQIHASKGYVRSTNKLGCDTTFGSPFSLPAAVFLLFGLGLIRTRRHTEK
jgi:hypothetical protein